jgi:hypothetical protein
MYCNVKKTPVFSMSMSTYKGAHDIWGRGGGGGAGGDGIQKISKNLKIVSRR